MFYSHCVKKVIKMLQRVWCKFFVIVGTTLNQKVGEIAKYFAQTDTVLSFSFFSTARLAHFPINRYMTVLSRMKLRRYSRYLYVLHATFSSENDIKQILLRRNIVPRYPTCILLFSTRRNSIIQVVVCWHSTTTVEAWNIPTLSLDKVLYYIVKNPRASMY